MWEKSLFLAARPPSYIMFCHCFRLFRFYEEKNFAPKNGGWLIDSFNVYSFGTRSIECVFSRCDIWVGVWSRLTTRSIVILSSSITFEINFWNVSISTRMNCFDGSIFSVVLFLFDRYIDFKTFVAQASVSSKLPP